MIIKILKKYKYQVLLLFLIISLGLFIAIFLLNTIYYYGNFKLKNLLINFIVFYNFCITSFIYIIKSFFNSLIKESILKIIIIGIISITILNKLKEMKVISSITSLEFKDFKVNIDTKKTKLDEEKKYNETNNNIYNVPEHVLKDQKQEIESLIIDMPFMASIIDSYLNRGLLNIKLNLNLIPYKITLSNLSKIFEYKLRANSVEIIKMRNDIEPIVVDCFKSLLEKGIIYIEN